MIQTVFLCIVSHIKMSIVRKDEISQWNYKLELRVFDIRYLYQVPKFIQYEEEGAKSSSETSCFKKKKPDGRWGYYF
jgi:hypothetical protein